jgi:hypothetical protein
MPVKISDGSRERVHRLLKTENARVHGEYCSRRSAHTRYDEVTIAAIVLELTA